MALFSVVIIIIIIRQRAWGVVTKFFTWFDIILRVRRLTAGQNTLSKKFSRPVCIGSRRPEIK